MIKILLLDSQLLTAQGVIALLAFSDFAITHSNYIDAADIRRALATHGPDILMIDPLQNGEIMNNEVLTELRELATTLPVVCLTNIAQAESLLMLADAGIRYHISKQASSAELFECLASAVRGKLYRCGLTRRLLAERESNVHPLSASLSDREKEIVILIADGRADKEIADLLFLSYHTVRTHRKNISRKLGFSLKNAAELTLLANALR